MEPFVQYAIVALITAAVIGAVVAFVRLKPRAEVAVEKALEAVAVDDVTLLVQTIAAKKQQAVALAAEIAAAETRFASMKATIAAMTA